MQQESKRQARISALITWLVMISVFVSSITFFQAPFEGYLHYFIFLILLPGFIKRFGYPRQPFMLLMLPMVVGILQIFAGNNTWPLFLKIYLGILLSGSFYYYVLQHYNLDTEYLFSLYMKGCFWVAVLGMIQVVGYMSGIPSLYNYSWLLDKWGIAKGALWGIRMNSIFPEASQCAIFLAPAGFVSVLNLLFKQIRYISRFRSLVILFAIFLTTSSTGYIGFLVMIVLLALNFARVSSFVFTTIFFIAVVNLLYKNIPEFRKRMDSAAGLWIEQDFNTDNVNSSSFVLYNNYHIALENFKRNPLYGGGLGSHLVAFDRYSITKQAGILQITFNKADANSLLLRLISETGLMGVIFIFVFIGRFFVHRRAYPAGNYWVICAALLTIIILYMLRQGNYFVNGFPFFMWLYYYNYQNAVASVKRADSAAGLQGNNESLIATS